MRIKELKKEIEIPESVEVIVEGKKITVNGPKGENSRYFLHPKFKITKEDNKIIILTKDATKKEKTMMGTYTAHVKNLLAGIKSGFEYKLKICSGHFPMTLTFEKERVMINNFMGEKVPRKAKIPQDVKVNIEGDTITVSGYDIEKVGQCAANIELATRRSGFDKRIFQDGCYIFSKAGREAR